MNSICRKRKKEKKNEPMKIFLPHEPRRKHRYVRGGGKKKAYFRLEPASRLPKPRPLPFCHTRGRGGGGGGKKKRGRKLPKLSQSGLSVVRRLRSLFPIEGGGGKRGKKKKKKASDNSGSGMPSVLLRVGEKRKGEKRKAAGIVSQSDSGKEGKGESRPMIVRSEGRVLTDTRRKGKGKESVRSSQSLCGKDAPLFGGLWRGRGGMPRRALPMIYVPNI